MIYDLAQLSADQLKKVQALEKDTGRTLIALRGLSAEPAAISVSELTRIQALEKDLGLTLVAVEA